MAQAADAKDRATSTLKAPWYMLSTQYDRHLQVDEHGARGAGSARASTEAQRHLGLLVDSPRSGTSVSPKR